MGKHGIYFFLRVGTHFTPSSLDLLNIYSSEYIAGRNLALKTKINISTFTFFLTSVQAATMPIT